MQDDDECALCSQMAETVGHLVLGCVVARTLWSALLIPLGLAALTPENDDDVAAWWLHQRGRVHPDATPIFDTMFLLIAWSMWKERNNTTFRRVPVRSTVEIARSVLAEAEDWVAAGFKTIAALLPVWSQNLANM